MLSADQSPLGLPGAGGEGARVATGNSGAPRHSHRPATRSAPGARRVSENLLRRRDSLSSSSSWLPAPGAGDG